MRFSEFTRWLLCCALLLGSALDASADSSYDEFVRAIENRNVQEVTRLLRRGVDPNTVDPKGIPVLVRASAIGALDIVRVLLDARANVNVRDQFGDSAIMVAALNGHVPVVRLLRQRGAEINHPGWTPLLYAATGGHDAIVEFLLRNAASLDTQAPNGVTALMMAVRENHASTVKLLLEHGSDPNVRSEDGSTALRWAKQRGYGDIVAILQRAGAVAE